MSEPERFRGKLLSDGSLEPIADESEAVPPSSDEQMEIARHYGKVVKAYLRAAEELAATKFAHIKEWIPTHLIESREVVVLACPDGLVIRLWTACRPTWN